MKFKIEFDPQRYYEGAKAYSLQYYKEYEAGQTCGSRSGYWAGAGHHETAEAAQKAASVVQMMNTTILFDV